MQSEEKKATTEVSPSPQDAEKPAPKPLALPTITISSGAVQVLASGLVTAFLNNPIQFSIGSDYVLIVVFEEEEGVEKPRTSNIPIDTKTRQVTCFNFKKQASLTGIVEPLNIATINIGTATERLLYLQIRTLALPNSDITLFYTFYAGEVKSGG